MEKEKLIVLVSMVIIISLVGYSLLNVYAIGQLKLSGIDNLFRFFSMSTENNKIKICNTFFFPANFNELDVNIYFEKNLLGTYTINSAIVLPNSDLETSGKYTSESLSQSQSLFMHFDHLFSNSDNTVRIDPRKMDVVTQFQTTIIGVPFSITQQYTAFDFWNMLNDETNTTC